jgi:uncharacterized membrane protein YphA (DoxX/SURF4 family)
MLGLFTRPVSVIFVLFTIFVAIAISGSVLQTLFQDLCVNPTVWTFVAIWLFGSGKYSLDHKFFGKKRMQNA